MTLTNWLFTVGFCTICILFIKDYGRRDTSGKLSVLHFFYWIGSRCVERGYFLPVRLVLTGRYLEMKSENAEMRELLAKSEGAYYLRDCQAWGESYGDLERELAESQATVRGLQRELKLCDALMERYEELLKTDVVAQRTLRDTRTGRYIESPCKEEEELEEDIFEYDEPVEDPESSQITQKVRVIRTSEKTESKAVRAYRMSQRGATKETIASTLGISKSSVRVYIANGKRELQEEECAVTTDGINYHDINGVEAEELRSRIG